MRRHLRTVAVLVLTIALLALFLRGVDVLQVGSEILRARWSFLLAALAMVGLTYVQRTLRWQYLLEPLGPTRFSQAFRATVIGFAATTVLPFRAGEVIRPYLLARRAGLSATATFATIALERLFDTITVVLFFGLYLVIFDPGLARVNPTAFNAVRLAGLVVAALCAAITAVFVIAAGRPESLQRFIQRTDRLLPTRLAHAVGYLVRMFAEGLVAVRHPQRLISVTIWSVFLWLSIGAGVWLVAHAFHIPFPFSGTFLVLALLTAGVAVPTPGAVGGFHEAFRFGMTTFFSVPNERAVGAALVLHAISFVPVALLGAFFMAQDGLNLARARKLAETAASEG